MSIKDLNGKWYNKARTKPELEAQIKALYHEFIANEETKDCWVDCIAICLDMDSNRIKPEKVNGFISGIVGA